MNRRETHRFDGAQRALHMLPVYAATTTTAIYTKSRIANKGRSPGGTAKSRGAIVNAGSV